MGGEEPVQVSSPGSVETELDSGRGQSGENARLEVDLKIQKQVEVAAGVPGSGFLESPKGVPEATQPIQQGDGVSGPAAPLKEDELVHCGMISHQLMGAGLQHPGDMGSGMGPAKGGDHRENQD